MNDNGRSLSLLGLATDYDFPDLTEEEPNDPFVNWCIPDFTAVFSRGAWRESAE